MKKSVKKIMSLVLALTMCFALGVTAFATEDPKNTSADTGTITIIGLEDGVTVTAYQIAKAVYDESTGYFTGYEMVEGTENAGFQIASNGSYDETELNEANLAELYAIVSEKGPYKTVTELSVNPTSGLATATFEDMAVGSYLFVVSGGESTTYSFVIASISYGADDSGNLIIGEGAVNVENTSAWVKKSDMPDIGKTESVGDGHTGSASVGDEVTYTIVVDPIPSYEGEYPTFKVYDISTNLKVVNIDDIVITIDDGTLVANEDYTVRELTADEDGLEEGQYGFCVDFVVDENYTLNDYAGYKMTITYTSVILADAANADYSDHNNDANLEFSDNSYIEGSEGTTGGSGDTGDENPSVGDTNHNYTFNARLKKVDQEDNALGGATFTLYTDESCETTYTQLKDSKAVAVTATSEAGSGYFTFTGLEAGTYYMKETEAPNGYALNTDIYQIDVTPAYYEEGEEGEGLKEVSITVTDVTNNQEVGSALMSVEDANRATITNVKTGSLPSMGAQGITTIIIAGCVVFVAAMGGAMVYRRRNNTIA